jgi:beta-lactamase superfamily II metal-dependent hydrolase
MSIIKSFAVGNGDMFYINHGSDNFTMIDCCLSDDNIGTILSEMKALRAKKTIARFISTHPDDDHLRGLEYLEAHVGIQNFYCVKNAATKDDVTDSFAKYCELRDDSKKAFYLFKGCSRKWMNQGDDARGSAGINILWPDVGNAHFKEALADAEVGLSPNNISAVIEYSLNGGANVLWMGDLESSFMEAIEDHLQLTAVDILFAPHHGRDSGKIPASMLEAMSPKIIVVGEAPSEHLHYYPEYNTITQNRAGDIVFACDGSKVHVFTSEAYEVDFLDNEFMTFGDMHYVGTLNL